MAPTTEQAYQFALMTMAGVPAEEALPYFIEGAVEMDPLQFALLAKQWAKSRAVLEQIVLLQKGDWTTLTPQQRIQLALDKHYNEMAYYLYTHNYAEISNPNLKQKADTCRGALEAKVAGMAGKMNALSTFWEDVMAGRAKTAARPV